MNTKGTHVFAWLVRFGSFVSFLFNFGISYLVDILFSVHFCLVSRERQGKHNWVGRRVEKI